MGAGFDEGTSVVFRAAALSWRDQGSDYGSKGSYHFAAWRFCTSKAVSCGNVVSGLFRVPFFAGIFPDGGTVVSEW